MKFLKCITMIKILSCVGSNLKKKQKTKQVHGDWVGGAAKTQKSYVKVIIQWFLQVTFSSNL